MTYTVKRLFNKDGITYGPYEYQYKSIRKGKKVFHKFVKYIGKGKEIPGTRKDDISRALQSGEGDISDSVSLYNTGKSFVVFDFETTGFSPDTCDVIQVSALKCKIENNELKVLDGYNSYANPGSKIPWNIQQLTGIRDYMVKKAPASTTVIKDFKCWLGNSHLIGHNVNFDLRFLHKRIGEQKVIDTLKMSRMLYGPDVKHKLIDVAKREKLSLESGQLHRTDNDVLFTAQAFAQMARKIRNISN